MDAFVTPAALRRSIGSPQPPLVIDVRRNERFNESAYMIRGALRRDPTRVEEWRKTLPRGADVVVYCVHGHEVSQGVARSLGVPYVQGGIEAWREAGGELDRKPQGTATRWVTRERPKIDRIACPWLIRRFVDPEAEFLYVLPGEVLDVAKATGAIAYDVPDVHFSHQGERCSFDAFLRHFRLADPALAELALIVRGADTARPELAPPAAGLAAISLGLSRVCPDDLEMLAHGMVLYDALYAWCREGKEEVHTWNPALYR
jgi:rhodanese-related sulfurtransferase